MPTIVGILVLESKSGGVAGPAFEALQRG